MTLSARTLLTLTLIAVPAAHCAVLDECRQNGKSAAQIGSCLRETQIRAEEALNAALGQARKQARSSPQALRNFDEGHQAWLAERSRECRRRFDREAPGSAAGEVRMACEIELTRQRAAEISSKR